MRIAGKDALDVVVRRHRERRHEGVEGGDEAVDGAADVEAEVGRHLVVAGAGGVQLLAHFPDAGNELVLDEGVDVLRALDLESALVDVLQNALEALADDGGLLGGNDVGFAEHGRMGDARGDVHAVEFSVKGERFVEGVGVLRGGRVEPSFPKFHYITSQRIVCTLDFTRFCPKKQAISRGYANLSAFRLTSGPLVH